MKRSAHSSRGPLSNVEQNTYLDRYHRALLKDLVCNASDDHWLSRRCVERSPFLEHLDVAIQIRPSIRGIPFEWPLRVDTCACEFCSGRKPLICIDPVPRPVKGADSSEIQVQRDSEIGSLGGCKNSSASRAAQLHCVFQPEVTHVQIESLSLASPASSCQPRQRIRSLCCEA